MYTLSLNNLALLYTRQGKYTEAEPLFQSALHIQTQILGSEHPRTAQTLSNIALLFLEQRHYAQAEPFIEQALAIQKKTLAKDHPDLIVTMERYRQLPSMNHRKTEEGIQREAPPFEQK